MELFNVCTCEEMVTEINSVPDLMLRLILNDYSVEGLSWLQKDLCRRSGDDILEFLYHIHNAGMIQELDQSFLMNVVREGDVIVKKKDSEIVETILTRLRNPCLGREQIERTHKTLLRNRNSSVSINGDGSISGIGLDTVVMVGLEFELRVLVHENEVRAVKGRVSSKLARIEKHLRNQKDKFEKQLCVFKKHISRVELRVAPLITDWHRFRTMEPRCQEIVKTLLLVRNDPTTVISPLPNELLLVILSFIEIPLEDTPKDVRVQFKPHLPTSSNWWERDKESWVLYAGLSTLWVTLVLCSVVHSYFRS